MKKLLLTLLTVVMSVSTWAEQVSWDLVRGANTCASQSSESVSFTSDYATFVVTKNESSTAANNYLGTGSGTKTNTRFYNGQLATFTPTSGYQITSIVVACDGSYTSYWTTSENQTNCSTSVSSNDVTITPTDGTIACSIKLTGTTRVKTVTINYSVASNDPEIKASDVTIESDATSGEIAYTIKNPVTGVNPTATITSGDWISNIAVNTTAGKVTFDATENTIPTDRTATITISYTGANDKVVTVTQKKMVVTTTYDKVSASSMVIGGTYVWYGQKADGTNKSVATAMSGTYLGAENLATESSITDTQLNLTSENPQQFIFSQVSDTEWTIADASTPTNLLKVSGDKQIAWNTEKNVWTLAGTTAPKFACASYKETLYTLQFNSGSNRFCAYTTPQQDAILYHLASESAHTLSCVIDNETTKIYNIKDGYTWALLTPEKDGYVFLGWATTADGAVAYADGADYTMPAANATLYAKWRQQTTAPVFTTDLNAAYNCNKGGAAVTLTVEATDADSYQWYKNATATTAGATAIVGATEASYNYSGTTIGTEYVYCVATNTVGSTTSTIAAVTTKGSNLAVLSHIEFSNNFDAFIKNNTVTAYYMAGTTAPTVNESSIVISDGAIYDINDNTLTVLAEDGETMVDYTISLSPVTPNTTAANEVQFDGTETWVKTGYGWSADKGWKFSKNTENDGVLRITDGRNRQYWFVGPATEFKLYNTLITSARNIKVYVNGVQQSITSVPKNDANTNYISITGLSATGNNMVTIVSNQTGGDGGFSKYTFTPAGAVVNVNNCGNASFSCGSALDFTDVAGVAAYIVTAETEENVTLTQINKVPANTGIIVVGTAGSYNVPVLVGAADNTSANKLVATTTAKDIDGSENIWALSKNDGLLHPVTSGTIAAGKAYLVSEIVAPSPARAFVFDNESTGIQSVQQNAQNSIAYNLAGQRVAANAKGIVIVNGKKFFNK